MKATIRGFRYNTETAIEVGTHRHGKQPDSSHWTATLYKTPRSNEFFLAGEGGSMSAFGHHNQDGTRYPAGRIFPMRLNSAFLWAQIHLDESQVKEHFQSK